MSARLSFQSPSVKTLQSYGDQFDSRHMQRPFEMVDQIAGKSTIAKSYVGNLCLGHRPTISTSVYVDGDIIAWSEQ